MQKRTAASTSASFVASATKLWARAAFGAHERDGFLEGLFGASHGEHQGSLAGKAQGAGAADAAARPGDDGPPSFELRKARLPIVFLLRRQRYRH